MGVDFNVAKVHAGLVRLAGQVKHTLGPHVMVALTDAGAHNSGEDHWSCSSCAFVYGTGNASVKQVLGSLVHAKVLQLLKEDEVDESSHNAVK